MKAANNSEVPTEGAGKFKERHPQFCKLYHWFEWPVSKLEDRKAQSEKILERYPDKIPVICEKHETSQLKGMDRTKYVRPFHLTIS